MIKTSIPQGFAHFQLGLQSACVSQALEDRAIYSYGRRARPFIVCQRAYNNHGPQPMILPDLVATLINFTQPFADMYADSKVLSVGTTLMHIGGLLAGGGLAIATDRAVLRVSPLDGLMQRHVLEDLASTHKLVIGAIAIIVVSGLMFLAADAKTFLVSPLYWIKMSAVALLLLNGLRMWRVESQLQKSDASLGAAEPMPTSEWQTLRGAAVTSVVLWFSVMTLGVVLAGV